MTESCSSKTIENTYANNYPEIIILCFITQSCWIALKP